MEKEKWLMNLDIRLQVIMPPFPTLLPNSSFEKFSNMSPFSKAVFLYQPREQSEQNGKHANIGKR